MAVYVDSARNKYGRMVMAHMWADTLDELLQMADKIGVARRHLQKPPHASWVHFDVCLASKQRALHHGAIQTDKYGPSEYVARLMGNTKMLDSIERIRATKIIGKVQSTANS